MLAYEQSTIPGSYQAQKMRLSQKGAASFVFHFMWLVAMATPDHNTINRSRSDKLKEVLKDVFTEIVRPLVNSGHVGLKHINVDGTKRVANAKD